MEELVLIQKFLLFCLCIPVIDLALKLKKNKNKLGTSILGTKLKGLTGSTGIKIAKDMQLSEKSSMEHVLVLGPTGAGKTTSLFLNNLLSNSIRGSIVVSDPKGELYKLTHKYQESIGRKTILFRPLEPGINYNPLENCKNDREVIKLAQNLLINGALSFELQTGKKASGVEWIQMAQGLLAAALLYVKNTPCNTISNALDLIISNDIAKLDLILSNAKDSVKTQYNTFRMCLESPKTMASIKVSLSTNLTLFTDNLSINNSNFTPESLREQETILYISYPENMAYYLAPFTAPFYSQLIDTLIDTYDNSMPVYFMFDEFANLGMLSNFTLNIATARSRKLSFFICLQSISQLYQIYGRDNGYSILNNAKTKIILPGLSDIETLRYVSELCGETEVEILQHDGKFTKAKKPLFTHEEIRTLAKEKLLIISSNLSPVLSTQDIYYKQAKYTKNL